MKLLKDPINKQQQSLSNVEYQEAVQSKVPANAFPFPPFSSTLYLYWQVNGLSVWANVSSQDGDVN